MRGKVRTVRTEKGETRQGDEGRAGNRKKGMWGQKRGVLEKGEEGVM